MPDPVAETLQQHARSLRELARALVGTDAADDVVQATALAALRHPHPVRQPLAFVRHLLRVQAARHHRTEGRRHRREARHAAGTGAAAPPAEHAIEHRETLASLHTALMAVPQPQLGALLLRYFEGLSPPAIAARLGVPVPTIKSRLQRGLELLRERLASGSDDDTWRERLRHAFALPSPAAVPVGSTLLLGLAAMKTTSLCVLAAALIAAAWWVLPEPPPPAPAPAAIGTGQAADTTHADAIVDTPAPRTAAPTADAAIPAAHVARVRGRVVGTNEAPIAGAQVEVLPEQATADPVATSVTAADGSFECAVAVAGPHRLLVRAERHVTARTDMRELAADGATDFGTLVVVPGVNVHGRVLDRDDRPVAAASIGLNMSSRRGPPGTWWIWNPATTDGDGRFTLGPLPPIEVPLHVTNEQLLEPLALQLGSAPGDVDIVVRVESVSRHLLLRGRVVDERGTPIAGATLTADEPGPLGSSHFEGTSGTDGTFRLRRLLTTEAKPVQLSAKALGRDRTRLEGVRWGQPELEVVLRPLLTGTVRVITARGSPVADYTLRIGTVTKAGGMTTHDGPFALHALAATGNGECTVPGLRRGLHDVHVTPDHATLAASGVLRWEVNDAERLLIVVVPDRCERVVRLQGSDGTPVAGARVELCQPAHGPIDLRSHAPDLANWTSMHVPHKSLLLQRGTTDADGRIPLRGPAGTALVVRVHGPGCVPFVQPLARLDGEAVLAITAQRGGTVRMLARPTDVLAQLTALPPPAGEPSPPRLALDRRLANHQERVPPETDGGVPFDAEGVALLRGVPPGTWTPRVQFAGECLLLPEVTIDDGRTIELPLDLEPLRPVTIRGCVTLDGARAAFRHVELQRLRRSDERHAGRWFGVGNQGIDLDADGVFVVKTVPSRFRLLLTRGADALGRSDALASPSVVDVAAGATIELAFAFALGTAAVRFVDEQQRPVVGLAGAWLRRDDGYFLAFLPPSDADGRARVDGIEAGPLRLVVLPRRFGDVRIALPGLYSDHPDDERIVERTLLDLGPLPVRAGDPLEATFVLPDAWFR